MGDWGEVGDGVSEVPIPFCGWQAWAARPGEQKWGGVGRGGGWAKEAQEAFLWCPVCTIQVSVAEGLESLLPFRREPKPSGQTGG